MSNVFSSLFKKNSALEKAFSEMEDEFSDLVLEGIEPPPLDPFADGLPGEEGGAAFELPDTAVECDHRLTSHTQARLATLSTFEEMHQTMRRDLDLVASTITKMNASHHSTNDFIATVHNSIHRANELELSNAALLAENRRLAQAADRVKRLSSQLETVTEAYKRREARFNVDSETLRVNLAASQLDANEARGVIARLEAERADLLNEVASKSSALERATRDAELLREKQVNLTMDLEAVNRRYSESRRKYDELSAIHTTEQSQIVELRARYAESEMEVNRLQKTCDMSQARLAECEETIAAIENESESRSKLQVAQITKLNDELEAHKARLEVSTRSLQAGSDEIASLGQQVADLATENRIAVETISGLKRELEAERKLMAGGQRSDDTLTAELAAMRSQAADMRATIDRLSKYEAMYRRSLEKSSLDDDKAHAAE